MKHAVGNMKHAALALALSTGALALAAVPGSAQEAAAPVATITDWTVFADGTPRECWSVSPPKSSTASRDGRDVTSSVRRGDIFLYATYRPASGVAGEIAFTGGYPFASGSTVKVQIGRESFDLVTQDDWAWSANADQDAALRAAMKGGEDAVVTGRSSRGTVTKDTFSLMGFTAALEEAEKRCK